MINHELNVSRHGACVLSIVQIKAITTPRELITPVDARNICKQMRSVYRIFDYTLLRRALYALIIVLLIILIN